MRTFILCVVLSGFALCLGGDVLAQEAGAASSAVAAANPDADVEARTLADWFEMGGWIMYLLVVTSMISVALILERSWALRRSAIIPRSFLAKVRDHSHRREIKPVMELCASSDNAIARVLRSGLLHFDEGLPRMEDAVETSGEHEATVLRRNLPLLAALGNMATMMGLLGTVLGMIESFDLIAKTGTGDARVVASGIFQALVTTAAGLMVGLFAIGFHSFLRRKVEVLEIDLEEKSFGLLEELWIGQQTGGGSDDLSASEA